MSAGTLVDDFSSSNDRAGQAQAYAVPATPLQVRVFSAAQGGVAGPAWNVAVRFRLTGPLDRDRLERALQSLLTRHEALRTTLHSRDGKVLARIASRGRLPVEWRDLSSLAGEPLDAAVIEESLDHAGQPFALGLGPLFRVRILRLSDTEHVMLWNASLAVCDGWSVGLLSDGVLEAYRTDCSSPLQQEALDFADYAVWLQEQRMAAAYQQDRIFWKDRLAQWPPVKLPITWISQDAGARACIQSSVLPRPLTDALTELAARHNATFFHATLALFATLVRSRQHRSTVALGTTLSGREEAELEPIVGAFMNYVPLDLRVDLRHSFAEILRAVSNRAAEALDYGRFRYEDMLAMQAETANGPSQPALFQAVFICQRDFVRPQTAGSLTLTAMPSVSPGALQPLTLFLVERADGWRLSCEVDGKTVSAAVGAALIRDFAALAGAAVKAPAMAVSDLLTSLALPAGQPGEASESETGEALPPAVLPETAKDIRRVPASETQTRFWLLNRVNPESTSFDLTIRLAITGTLDLEALRAAAESVMAANEILRTTFEEVDGNVWQLIHPQGTLAFEVCEGAPGDAAWNAPGKPFALDAGPLFRIQAWRVAAGHTLLKLTLSHAIADGWSCGLLLEQLRAAYERHASGATETTPAVLHQFSEYVEVEQRLLESGDLDRRLKWWRHQLEGQWTNLRLPRDIEKQTGSSGEVSKSAAVHSVVLDPDLAQAVQHFASKNSCTLLAVFGAVLQTLVAYYSQRPDVLTVTHYANRTDGMEGVIGPLAIPICVPGHIDFAGSFRSLAVGFCNRVLECAEYAVPFNLLTAQIDIRSEGQVHPLNQVLFFHRRPFVHDAQWGNLQIKSMPEHAFLASGEWQLGTVERNGQISLELQYDADLYTQQRIAAVCRQYISLLTHAIAAPDSPLAAHLAILQQIPLATGHADIAASNTTKSPAPAAANTPSSAVPSGQSDAVKDPLSPALLEEPLAPCNVAIEQRMIQIWQQIFKVKGIDGNSEFFDLGGHSLLLARLQIAVKKEFGVQMTAADLFRNPTVHQLTEWVSRAHLAHAVAAGVESNPRIIPIQTGGTERPLFVISQSMIFRTLAAELGKDQPVYTLQVLDTDIEAGKISADFNELIEYYLQLLRSVQPKGPYRLAGWCVSGWLACGVARRLEQEGETIELLMVMDAWAPGYWQRHSSLRRLGMKAVYRWQRLRWVLRRLAQSTGQQRLLYVRRSLHAMAAAIAQNLTVQLQRLGLPVQVRLTEEMRRGEQLEYTATRHYDSGPIRGEILIFSSEEQPCGLLLAPDMGWSEVLERPIAVERLPGDHHEIFSLPGARVMAQRARVALQKSAKKTAASTEKEKPGSRLSQSAGGIA
jgi:thioesterase domain-containing protein/non-ribosomal peptide synthetase component F/acyl carrier protein